MRTIKEFLRIWCFPCLVTYCFFFVGCDKKESVQIPKAHLSNKEEEEAHSWATKDAVFDWLSWDEAMITARKEERPVLFYVAAPGCDGLFERPSSLLRRLIEESFVSVHVNPFIRPDWAERLSIGGCPALVVAMPNGRIFSRAIDIPPRNVEDYLFRLHGLFVDDHSRLLAKMKVKDKRMSAKYSLDQLREKLLTSYDPRFEGLFGPQKFAHATALRFLLYHGSTSAREIVRKTVSELIRSPLMFEGGFILFSYSPDWQQPSIEMDALDQADIVRLLIDLERWDLIDQWVAFVKEYFFDMKSGAFHGRLLRVADKRWWSDPSIYVDRMAVQISCLIEIARLKNDSAVRHLALEGINFLLDRCVDSDGVVSHTCDSIGANGLLADQALVALALSAWSEFDGDNHSGQVAKMIMSHINLQNAVDTSGPGNAYVANWHLDHGQLGVAKEMIKNTKYNPDDYRTAALWGLLEMRLMRLE